MCFVVNIVSVLIKVFIIVKIKYANSGRISDKVNITTNYIHFTTPDNILSKTQHFTKHIQILQFLTPLAGRSRYGALSVLGQLIIYLQESNKY